MEPSPGVLSETPDALSETSHPDFSSHEAVRLSDRGAQNAAVRRGPCTTQILIAQLGMILLGNFHPWKL